MPLETSVLTLSDLLSRAAGNDPLARAALPAAQEEFVPPPPPRKISLSSGEDITPFDPKFGAPAPSLSEEGGDEGEGSGVNWRQGLGQGLGGLLGLGIARLAGGGEAAEAFGAGYGQNILRDMQQKQTEQLRRRQRAWETAYEEAQKLPPDVFSDPRLTELRDAHASLMKDLQDNKIDNEKTLGQFLTAKAKYGKELEQVQIEHQAKIEKESADRKMNEDFSRRAQQVTRWKEIVDNPEAYPEGEVAMAMQAMQSMPEMVNTPFGDVPMTPEEKFKWTLAQQDAATKKGQLEWGQKMDVSQLGLGARRLDLMEQGLAGADRERSLGSAARAIQSSITQRLRIKAAEAKEMMNPLNIEAEETAALIENAPLIESATGLEVTSDPGDMGLVPDDPMARPPGGYSVKILGMTIPLTFDPTTKEGKVRLLKLAYSQLQARGGGELGLLGAFGGE